MHYMYERLDHPHGYTALTTAYQVGTTTAPDLEWRVVSRLRAEKGAW